MSTFNPPQASSSAKVRAPGTANVSATVPAPTQARTSPNSTQSAPPAPSLTRPSAFLPLPDMKPSELAPMTVMMASDSIQPAMPSGAPEAATEGRERDTRNILKLAVKSKAALYSAYMTGVKGGGIFIPTKRDLKLGDEVHVILTLLDDPKVIPLTGKVCWISPATLGRFQKGLGVQFPNNEQGRALQRQCEELLGVHVASTRENLTF
jgi:type IV pilus assembly protein PilZ